MTVLVGYLPTLEGNAAFSAALERAAAAGYTHLNLDSTVIQYRPCGRRRPPWR
jgi:hypothetical protein